MVRLVPGRLAVRMWMAPAVPILTLWACIAIYNVGEYGRVQEMARVKTLALVVGRVGALAHEIEKERTAAATASGLEAQARVTDQVLADFSSSLSGLPLDPRLDASLSSARSALARLPEARKAPAAEAVEAYAAPITALLAVGEAAARMPADPQALAMMTSLVAIEQAKERAAREHALIARGSDATGLPSEQSMWLAAFRLHATPSQARALDSAPSTVGPGRREALQATAAKVVHDLTELADQRSDEIRGEAWTFNLAMVGAAVLGGIVVIALVRGLTGPLARMAEVMRLLSAGNTSVPVPETGRADEVGEMARALQVFKDNALAMVAMQAEQQRLEDQAEETRRRSLREMADKVESETGAVVAKVAAESERVREMATRMAGSATTVGDNSQGVAEAARHALANVQVVAEAAAQLSHSIRAIASEMDHSGTVIERAVEATQRSTEIMRRMVHAAGQIDEVVAMIAEIAGQTNLLALNASIEAQRAGDAGKGFAVVANEVKRLANVTASQTEEITRRIADLQAIAGSAAGAFGEVETAMREVHTIAGTIGQAVSQQDSATQDIARNVAETSEAAIEVSERIAAVAAEASVTGESAGEVRTLLDAMAAQVAQLSHVLTAVVRTATPDVDRRNRLRITPREPVMLTVDGFPMPGTLLDLSPIAARIDAMPTLMVGMIGTLSWNEMDIPISVASQDKGITRVMLRSGWDGAPRLAEAIRSRMGAAA
ncbi:MAG: methyl-accepting chemotaxis protein [Solirubrobacterales bacterium]